MSQPNANLNADTPPRVTAAVLVIGDEILSGRTKDKNIGTLADYLTASGIELREVRIVPDVEAEIIAAIVALKTRYTYLFTTGGIGPTHDDITADCVAKACHVEIAHNQEAIAMLQERYAAGELNETRLRMARIPVGATLIANPISKAPGFMIENIITMAGVPSIMQVMLDNIGPELKTGVKITSVTIDVGNLPEGIYGEALGKIAKDFPMLSLGSYPSFSAAGFNNKIVLRGKDLIALETARQSVEECVAELKSNYKRS